MANIISVKYTVPLHRFSVPSMGRAVKLFQPRLMLPSRSLASVSRWSVPFQNQF